MGNGETCTVCAWARVGLAIVGVLLVVTWALQ